MPGHGPQHLLHKKRFHEARNSLDFRPAGETYREQEAHTYLHFREAYIKSNVHFRENWDIHCALFRDPGVKSLC